jgi:rare lipoprotein A
MQRIALASLLAMGTLVGCFNAAAEEASVGIASFYAAVPKPRELMTAAHRSLPFGTWVRVTRMDTGKHVDVRINDRGPFINGRIIDISRRAAEQIGMLDAGLARVKVEICKECGPAWVGPHD